MASFPLDAPKGTVTGRVLSTGGEPLAGELLFVAAAPHVLEDTGSIVYARTEETAQLDATGAFSIELLASTGAGVNPSGWTWQLVYRLTKDGRPFTGPPSASFALPAGATLQLGTITPVAASTGTPTTKGDKGDKGDTGATPVLTVAAETLAPGSPATVGQSGTPEAPSLLFGIPSGLKGDKGDKGDQGAPGNATMRVDTSVGTRVYMNDGAAERLVYADTGWRDIASLLPAGLTVSASGNASRPMLRRINDTVSLELYLDCTGANITSLLELPVGYRPRVTISRPGQVFVDTAGTARPLPSTAVTWYLSSASVRTGSPLPNPGTVQVTARWTTSNAWPATLPGTPT